MCDGVQVPGGTAEESEVLQGVMLNKDVTHPRMRRRIENPRIVLLDCPLEYKKGESQVRRKEKGEEEVWLPLISPPDGCRDQWRGGLH